MKRQKNTFRLLIPVLIIFTLLVSSGLSTAQTSGNKYFISELDCSAFPTISLLVRGIDGTGSLITPDLLVNNFTIFENGQPVQTIQQGLADEAPIYIVFSFDLGNNSNLAEFNFDIQELMRVFANEYFREGKDTIDIVYHTNISRQSMNVVGPITAQSDFEDAIDNLALDRSNNPLQGFFGLRELFDSLSSLNPGRYSMAIIHFSRLVEGISPNQAIEEGTSLGTQMASENIRVHVFNTDKSGGANNVDPPFQALTQESGGNYFPYTNPPFSDADITRLFDSIRQNSQAYRIQFQAQALNAEYSLAPIGASTTEATDSQSCTDVVPPPAPELQITQPTGINPSAFLQEGQSTIPIMASLQNWPQDGSRRITKAELLVGGIVASTQELAPDFGGTTFTFDWDVTQLSIQNSLTVVLQVRLQDQFGVTGVSPEVQLQIFPFITPTATPESSSGPVIVPSVSEDCKDAAFTPKCLLETILRNLIWILPIGLFVILFIIVLILFINTNRKLSALTSPARNAISKGIEQVRKTLLGGTSVKQEPMAYLQILAARSDRAGGKVEIVGDRTTLGRDPNLTDVQLYNVDDETSVSGLHCTIFYDQGQFFITDDNSTNGTYVNGKRINPNEPIELYDNAEIVLGNLARKGAKLKFQLASSSGSGGSFDSGEDFHFDLPVEGAPYSPPPAQSWSPPPIDDSRKTVPGYRADDPGEKTDIFYEPPPSLPPAPRPAPRVPPPQPNPPKPQPRKKSNDDWEKDLG